MICMTYMTNIINKKHFVKRKLILKIYSLLLRQPQVPYYLVPRGRFLVLQPIILQQVKEYYNTNY